MRWVRCGGKTSLCASYTCTYATHTHTHTHTRAHTHTHKHRNHINRTRWFSAWICWFYLKSVSQSAQPLPLIYQLHCRQWIQAQLKASACHSTAKLHLWMNVVTLIAACYLVNHKQIINWNFLRTRFHAYMEGFDIKPGVESRLKAMTVQRPAQLKLIRHSSNPQARDIALRRWVNRFRWNGVYGMGSSWELL